MVWDKFEERLQKALTVKVSFPSGTVWLPPYPLTVDDWLTSIAETDEELRELNIPRIRFLQNHWTIVSLVELEWDDDFANKRNITAMYVGQRAYILFSDWSEYQVIAAIEPKDNPTLYKAVVGKLLENRSFIHKQPTHIRNCRPDLLPDLLAPPRRESDRKSTRSGRWKDFVSERRRKNLVLDILVGWIGNWLNIPKIVYWQEDVPQSVSTTNKGGIGMRYKATYGDKQRDAQKRKKEEQLKTKEIPQSETTPATERGKADEDRAKEEKSAA
jgi:hypothetical protein